MFNLISRAYKKGVCLDYLCNKADLSISGFYKHTHNKTNKIERDKSSYDLIKDICNTKKSKAGIRTIHMILRNKYGIIMNIKKIARIKKEYGLMTKIRKKNPYNIALKKNFEHRVAPNILEQNFHVDLPDKVYSTDISYLPYYGGKRAYLSAIKDLATREIVGFNIGSNMGVDMVYHGINELLKNKAGLIVHSDQGFHYTHPMYINMLIENGITQSMSRKGNCLDNAPIESFFGHMKDDIELKTCKSFEEVKEMVENYINYYNNERCQWNLNKMTPVQYRRHLLESQST